MTQPQFWFEAIHGSMVRIISITIISAILIRLIRRLALLVEHVGEGVDRGHQNCIILVLISVTGGDHLGDIDSSH